MVLNGINSPYHHPLTLGTNAANLSLIAMVCKHSGFASLAAMALLLPSIPFIIVVVIGVV